MIPPAALALTSYTLTNVTLPPLVMGLVTLAMGAFVLLRERGSRVGVTFWWFAVSVGTWLFALGAACAAESAPLALWWVRIANVGVTFLPSVVFLFTLTVVERLREFRTPVLGSFAVSAIFCAGSLSTDWFIKGLDRQVFGYHFQYGPLNAFFLIFLFGMMAASLRLYWVEYRRAGPGTPKQRFEGFLLAFCVAYLGSFDYVSIHRAPVYPFGYLPIFVFFLMASRAVKRYRLASIVTEFAAGHILDTMQGAVLVTDLQGNIQVANRAACAMLGFGSSEFLGKPLEAVMELEMRDRLALSPPNLLRHATVRDHGMVWHAKDGQRVNVSVSASVLSGRDQMAVGMVYVALDITERRQGEEQLRAANTRLEELALLKDEFVATVSHELRTPLTAIKEGIGLMLDGALGTTSGEQREFLVMVDENIDRLAELINNILDLSKIEAGRLRLARRRLPIRPLIDTIIQSYKALAGRRAVTVRMGEVSDAFADPHRLLQVFGNLFSNAIKFTKEEGAITFAVRERDGHLAVSVGDDGEGIAKDDLPKLFQKFSQVGPGGMKSKGTGLGLVLCKELVELHRGTITVDSEPGHGTAFTFTLPVYTARFALEDSFQEAVELMQRSAQETLGMMVIAAGEDRLEQVAEHVRKHIKRGDHVLSIEPHWVVILMAADPAGIQTVVKRLRAVLQEWAKGLSGEGPPAPPQFGVALYPADGQDVHRLFAAAAKSLNQGSVAFEEEGAHGR